MTAATRSNVLTLQSLQQKISASESRLAAGNRITAALDNPSVYFAAKGLNERADDLIALKDAMGQAISTVKAADVGVQHIGELVEQAKGLTVAALQNLGDDPASRESRRKLAEQYDGLLAQIDKTAEDSGYAGKNLIGNVRTQFLPSVASKAEAASVPGIRRADVSNASATDTYKVRVHGDGAISASDDSLHAIDDSLGLKNFRLFGFNSLTEGNFDDLTLTLRRQGADKAMLSIQDGNETRNIEIDLKNAANVTRPKAFRTEFQSGAWVAFDYDVADLAKRLTNNAIIEVPVSKNIDLSMDVTDNSGRTVSHSLMGQDGDNRIVAGENSFIFDGGTVRVDVDPKLIQQASNYAEKLKIDGPLAPALNNLKAHNRAVDGTFTINYEEHGQFGYLIPQPTFGFDQNYGFASQMIQRPPAIAQQVSFGFFSDGGWITADADFGLLEAKSTSAVRIQQTNPYAPSVIPIMGTWNNDDFPVGWGNFSASTTVLMDVGGYDTGGAGKRKVTFTDTTGSSAETVVGNMETFPSDAFTVTLKGGANDGAFVTVYAGDGSGLPYQQRISVFTNSAVYNILGSNYGPSSVDIADADATSNIATSGTLNVVTGADDSSRAGYRTVSLTPVVTGINGGTHNFEIPNAAVSNQRFTIPSGYYKGITLQFDFATGSGGDQYFIDPAPKVATASPTTVVYRAANPGKPFELNVQQHTSASDGADLRVQLGTTPNDNLIVRALNLTTNGTGLRIDRSVNGWGSREDIEKAAAELDGAMQKLRSAGMELSNGLNIITSRETFTKEFSDVLSEGATKLTLLDQNEEGSNLLMLQTQQQLSMTALSLATKSQQSILNLF
ncbi:flagellin [Azospirillum brasilense]|uniref:flagellin N-terminal helical domain-containing protein n=1 Tax=Azospirillum brasilense TaxID=192 RepID=UPI00157A876E|nr:flagellin [Azospirillum brasilense]